MAKDPTTGELKELTKPKRSGLPDWFSPDESSDNVEMFEVSIPDEAVYGTVWIDWRENKVLRTNKLQLTPNSWQQSACAVMGSGVNLQSRFLNTFGHG